MRLLNVSTREVEEFNGASIPPYAILSHTWGNEEVSFPEMEAIARYRRSQQEYTPPILAQPGSTDNPDHMKLMLLSTMLMAFRGDRIRANRPLSSATATPLPAITNGYESDRSDDDTRSQSSRGDRSVRSLGSMGSQASQGRVVPASAMHPFEHKAGYAKISYACGQAEKDGFRYVWIDTCCIDKRNLAEMSEAINAMFGWYQRAAVCYAFLEDVHFDDYTEGYRTWEDHFNDSRWFMRGWTLQELLAPRKVVFYAKGWRLLGTKSSLVKHVARITGVEELALLEPRLIHNASVAQRMSWAAHRTTTKPEDLAYALLGLFEVNMPILYGEGGDRAFLRLQEEIMKRTDDHTLFAWGTLGDDEPDPHAANNKTDHPADHPHHHDHLDLDEIELDDLNCTTPILATSPRDFAGMQHIVAAPTSSATIPAVDYSMTNKGLHIRLHLIRTVLPGQEALKTGASTAGQHYLAILPCHLEDDPGSRLAFLLTETSTPNVFLRARPPRGAGPMLLTLAETAAAKARVVYIPNSPQQGLRGTASGGVAGIGPAGFGDEAAKRLLVSEVVFVRTPDLVAPGYDVVDIQAAGGVQWNKEFRSIRLEGVDYSCSSSRGRNEGGLYQLAVVTFWNRHLKCGFVARVLVEGLSKAVFVDLVPARHDTSTAINDDEDGKWLIEEAKRVWQSPGTIQVTLPGQDEAGNKKSIQVDVRNPTGQEQESKSRNAAWTLKAGQEVQVAASVTFTEKWERDYQRTVNAKVERKKKGAIELNMTSMLWQAVAVAKGEDLDQPS